MTQVVTILFILWAIRIAVNIAGFAHLWWVKEYRFDRMLIHLGTAQGKRILFMPLRRPHFGLKTVIIVGASFVALTAVALYVTNIPMWARLLIADVSAFPLTAFIVLILKIPTYIYHEMRIRQAVEKLRAHPHVLVIGITGSYGKTSTKEMLASVLSEKYHVLKTEKSKNSPIAVAEAILSDLRDDHNVFIVEMGAYKKGEIARMSAMTSPQIGIVTAINEQHQDLFGTLENTMKAKYELVAGLVGKKTAIMNADNERVRTMAEWAKRDGREVVWYSTEKNTDLYATDIKQTKNGISFAVHFDKHKKIVSVPLLGAHHVSNILAVLGAAIKTGMTFDEAISATGNIVAFAKTMQPMQGPAGSTYINDTSNNNPDAAIAAINVLAQIGDGKKYIVFQPMIELGAYADDAHTRVGVRAAEVADGIYLTNWNFHEAFMRGVRSVNADIPVAVLSGTAIAEKLKDVLTADDVVLFKGKEAGAAINF